MNGIYPIVDVDSCERVGIAPLELARALLERRPRLLQLRAKHASPRVTLELLRQLRELCADSPTLLFANDRPDLALLAGCDGVHLGQEDLEPAEVRRFAPQLAIGLSTHDLPQLEAALAQAPAYVAFGPLFPTRSKLAPDPLVSREQLRQARELASSRAVPLVGIGGVSLDTLPEVAPLLDMVALISGITHADCARVGQAFEAFEQTFERARPSGGQRGVGG